jgi:predicted ATPase
MAQLTSVAQKVLTLAAVIGQRWNIDLLLEVAELEEHALIELLKEAVAAQLVVEESPDHFVFRHALTRQAIYSTLLARDRRIHHRLIAERLEPLPTPVAESNDYTCKDTSLQRDSDRHFVATASTDGRK